ncbi:MAG TPA: 2OG-Fe(II) oxygenase [Polyangia bacterium]
MSDAGSTLASRQSPVASGGRPGAGLVAAKRFAPADEGRGLNDEWAMPDGGELLLYRADEQSPVTRILPKPGLMVLFLSEEFPHEVLAPSKPRHSIAGWFRGRDERLW